MKSSTVHHGYFEDYLDSDPYLPPDAHAKKILERANSLYNQTAVTMIGVPLKINHETALHINNTYQKNKWHTGIDKNVSPIAYYIEKLLADEYRHLQPHIEFLPMTTCAHPGSEGETKAEWVEDDLRRMETFIQNGGVILGWKNPDDSYGLNGDTLSTDVLFKNDMQNFRENYPSRYQEKSQTQTQLEKLFTALNDEHLLSPWPLNYHGIYDGHLRNRDVYSAVTIAQKQLLILKLIVKTISKSEVSADQIEHSFQFPTNDDKDLNLKIPGLISDLRNYTQKLFSPINFHHVKKQGTFGEISDDCFIDAKLLNENPSYNTFAYITGNTYSVIDGIQNQENSTQIYDAAYYDLTPLDDTGSPDGFILGIADGCSHPENGTSDADNLYNMTEFVLAEAVSMVRTKDNPADLEVFFQSREANGFVQKLDAEANKKALNWKVHGEPARTTLSIGRSYKIQDNNDEYQFVGISLGKSMLVSIDTTTNRLEILADPVKKPAPDLTDSFPRLPEYKSEHPQVINKTLKSSQYVVGISDGIFDELPHDENNKLDIDAINQLISGVPPGSSIDIYLQVLKSNALESIKENKKKIAINNDILKNNISENEKEISKLKKTITAEYLLDTVYKDALIEEKIIKLINNQITSGEVVDGHIKITIDEDRCLLGLTPDESDLVLNNYTGTLGKTIENLNNSEDLEMKKLVPLYAQISILNPEKIPASTGLFITIPPNLSTDELRQIILKRSQDLLTIKNRRQMEINKSEKVKNLDKEVGNKIGENSRSAELLHKGMAVGDDATLIAAKPIDVNLKDLARQIKSGPRAIAPKRTQDDELLNVELQELYATYKNKYYQLLNNYTVDHIAPKLKKSIAMKVQGWAWQNIMHSVKPSQHYDERLLAAESLRDTLVNCKSFEEIKEIVHAANNGRKNLKGTHSDLINIFGSMAYDLKKLENDRQLILNKQRNIDQQIKMGLPETSQPRDEILELLKGKLRKDLLIDTSRNISVDRILNIKADTPEDYLQILKAEKDNIINSIYLHRKLRDYFNNVNHYSFNVPAAINSNLREFVTPTVNDLLKYVNKHETGLTMLLGETGQKSYDKTYAKMQKAGELAHALLRCKTRDDLKEVLVDAQLFQSKLKIEGRGQTELINIIDKLQEEAQIFMSNNQLRDKDDEDIDINNIWQENFNKKLFKSESKRCHPEETASIDLVFDETTRKQFNDYFNEIKQKIKTQGADAGLASLRDDDQIIGNKLFTALTKYIVDNKTIDDLSLETFINLMMNGLIPKLFAENVSDAQKMKEKNYWSDHEKKLLGNLARKVKNVEVYTRSSYRPTEKDIIKPAFGKSYPRCDMVCIDGALLTDTNPIDKELVLVDNWQGEGERPIDREKYKKLLKQRILPALIDANNTHPEGVIITTPTLGGLQFAGNYVEKIGELFPQLFQEIVSENIHALGNIKAIVHVVDPKFGDQTKDKVTYIAPTSTSRVPYISTNRAIGFSPKLDEKIFSTLPKPLRNQLKKSSVTAFIAGDRFSFPGNDAYEGSPATQEGAAGSYTNLMYVVTKIKGKFKQFFDNQNKFKAAKYISPEVFGENHDRKGEIKTYNEIYKERSKSNKNKIILNVGEITTIKTNYNEAETNTKLYLMAKDLLGVKPSDHLINDATMAARKAAMAIALSQSRIEKDKALGLSLIEAITPEMIEQYRRSNPVAFFAQLCLAELTDLGATYTDMRHKGIRSTLESNLQHLLNNLNDTSKVSLDDLRHILTYQLNGVIYEDNKRKFGNKTSRLGQALEHFLYKEMPGKSLINIIDAKKEEDLNILPTVDQDKKINQITTPFTTDLYVSLADLLFKFTLHKNQDLTWNEIMAYQPEDKQAKQFLLKCLNDYVNNNEMVIANYSVNTIAVLGILKDNVSEKINGHAIKNKLNLLYYQAIYLKKKSENINGEYENFLYQLKEKHKEIEEALLTNIPNHRPVPKFTQIKDQVDESDTGLEQGGLIDSLNDKKFEDELNVLIEDTVREKDSSAPNTFRDTFQSDDDTGLGRELNDAEAGIFPDIEMPDDNITYDKDKFRKTNRPEHAALNRLSTFSHVNDHKEQKQRNKSNSDSSTTDPDEHDPRDK